MKLNIHRIRALLQENKIFFETVTASALLVMALVVSIMAVVVSCQANRIASNQLSVAKSEHLPFFQFEIDQRMIGHDDLVIYNRGSNLTEFNYEAYIFWRVDCGKEGKHLSSVKIPITNYYPIGSLSNQPIGELVRLSGERGSGGNDQKSARLDKEFGELAKKNKALGSISIERYVWVKYRNSLGEIHEDMFSVTLIGSRKLSKDEERNILEDYNNKVTQQMYINLSNASAELLYEKWKASNKSKE